MTTSTKTIFIPNRNDSTASAALLRESHKKSMHNETNLPFLRIMIIFWSIRKAGRTKTIAESRIIPYNSLKG